MVGVHQRPQGLGDDVAGQQQERRRDEPLGAALGRGGGGARAREAPEQDPAGRRLDDAVRAEADQRDGRRSRAGGDRHGGLDGVPGDAGPGQQLRSPDEPRAPVQGRSRGGDDPHEREPTTTGPRPRISTASPSPHMAMSLASPRSIRRSWTKARAIRF